MPRHEASLRLALVTQDFPPERGGVQTYSFELARRWARESELVVIAPAVPGDAAHDASLPFEVRRVRAPRNLFFAACVAPLRELGPGFTSFHSHWFTAMSAELLRDAGRLGSVFVAAHGRELLFRPWSRARPLQSGYDAVRQRTLRAADGIFAVSHFTAKFLAELGLSAERLEVHPNGTDPERFYPGPKPEKRQRRGLRAKFIALCVARLVPRKGIDQVIRSMAALITQGIDAELLVVGEGPERSTLERLANELGISAKVTFTGAVTHEELLDCYHAADVFVLPARSEGEDVEGYGLVFLEANACGLPVIGPNVGGPAEAIEAGVTGLCVPPRSDSALTEVLTRLARDPELGARLGEQGRRRVLTERNWTSVANGLLQSIRKRAREQRKHELR